MIVGALGADRDANGMLPGVGRVREDHDHPAGHRRDSHAVPFPAEKLQVLTLNLFGHTVDVLVVARAAVEIVVDNAVRPVGGNRNCPDDTIGGPLHAVPRNGPVPSSRTNRVPARPPGIPCALRSRFRMIAPSTSHQVLVLIMTPSGGNAGWPDRARTARMM